MRQMLPSVFMNKFLVVSLAVGLQLCACKSDKPNPRPATEVLGLPLSSNVLVVNEGNYNFGNAGLSFLDGRSGQINDDIFQTANNRSIGDVAQSAVVHNNKLFVAVNNSQSIEVVDPYQFKSIHTIKGFQSPRYIQPVGNAKAYVSDLYANAISVVDLNQYTIIKTIPCTGWTERMVYHLGKVYVCNYTQPYLYVIDPISDTKSDSIHIGKGANSLVVDKHDRIIVACGGYRTPQSDTRLVFINPYTQAIVKSIAFEQNYPNELVINATKDTLYFLNTGIHKLSIEANKVGSPFISSNQRVYYGLGLDPKSNQLFVADAIDYVQKGRVYVYHSSGQPLASFDAGINPNGFVFY